MRKAIIFILLTCLVSVVADPHFAVADKQKKGRKYFEERGEAIWDVATDKKVIAMTFDDGPNPIFTPEIVGLLEQYDAKATFFVVGAAAAKYPGIVKNIVAKGHEIGNHTYSHPGGFKQLKKEAVSREIERAQKKLLEVAGTSPKLFRPPGGNYNELIVGCAKEKGLLVVLWSWNQKAKDWHKPGAKKIARDVLADLRPGDIVLMHDNGGNRRQTVNALKIILPELKKRGYKCVTITQLTNMRTKKFRQ